MSLRVQFLTKTTRYAMAATTALAELQQGERIPSAELAERTLIPRAFLGKVLTQLSRAGLVYGVKGHGGGYCLARAAGEIHLLDVVEALQEDGEALPATCALGAVACDPLLPCALHDRWTEIRGGMRRLLASVTVAEAAAGHLVSERALLARRARV